MLTVNFLVLKLWTEGVNECVFLDFTKITGFGRFFNASTEAT